VYRFRERSPSVRPHLSDAETSLQLWGVVHAVLICYAAREGYGKRWSELSSGNVETIQRVRMVSAHGTHETDSGQIIYAAQLFFVLSTGFTRISTAHLTGRILVMGSTRTQFIIGLNLLCGAWMLASIFAMAVRPPLLQPWLDLTGGSTMVCLECVVEQDVMLINIVC
jgi:Na+-translocating ferredoxin:NAD+ oxidoreductase RnfD subunit